MDLNFTRIQFLNQFEEYRAVSFILHSFYLWVFSHFEIK